MQNTQSFDKNFYAPTDLFAAAAAADERAGFIMKTYLYLFGAIAVLIGIETCLFTMLGIESMVKVTQTMLGGQYSWLIVLGAFMPGLTHQKLSDVAVFSVWCFQKAFFRQSV